MENLPSNEKWIKGMEGVYSVSYEGEIYSYKKNTKTKLTGGVNRRKSNGKIMIRQACLFLNGKPITVNYQTIVADVWIPNLDNKPNVFHKDFNKMNNSVDNLIRVTPKEQAALVYASKKDDIRQTRKSNKGFGLESDVIKFITTGDLLGYKTFARVKNLLTQDQMNSAGVPVEMLNLTTRSTSYLNHWNYIITFMDYVYNREYTLQDVAGRFNVDQSMVSLVRNGKRWTKEDDVYKKYRNNPDFTVNYLPTFKV